MNAMRKHLKIPADICNPGAGSPGHNLVCSKLKPFSKLNFYATYLLLIVKAPWSGAFQNPLLNCINIY